MANQVDASPRYIRYTVATSTQADFNITFPLDALDAIAVYKNGALEDPTHYSVNAAGTVVTFGVGHVPVNSDIVTLDGNTSIFRKDGFSVRGPISSALLNKDANRETMILQELQRNLARRLYVSPDGSSAVRLAFPPPQADRVVVGAGDGLGWVNGPLITDIAAVAADLANINLVAAGLTNVNTVAANVGIVGTVAGSIGAVAGVAAAIGAVVNVNANIANVNAVGGAIANVNTVAGSAANIASVLAGLTNINAVAGDLTNINTAAGAIANINNAPTYATNAFNSAAAALVSQNAAAASAAAALASQNAAAVYAAALSDTSTTSLAIATGAKVFTVSASKQWAAGQFISAVSAANNANYMHGQVTSYSGTTLTLNVTDIGGSGTKADWNIAVSGSQGSQGIPGAAGGNFSNETAFNNTAGGTVDLGTATYPLVSFTGTAAGAVASFGTTANPTQAAIYFCRVEINSGQVFTVGYNATSMITPTKADMSFYTGDAFLAQALGSGNWKILAVFSRSGSAETMSQYSAIAAAATTDLGSGGKNFVHITASGGVNITAFGATNADIMSQLYFVAVQNTGPTIKYNATTLITPNAGDIVTAAGDFFIIENIGSTGTWDKWRIRAYYKADGTPLVTPAIAAGSVTASMLAAPASLLYAGTAGGTANAQTLTPTPALGAYAAGDERTFLPVATNTSGAVTVNVSGLGTKNIKKFIGGAVVALAVNDLIINQPAEIIYDGTQYILMNPQTFTQGADVASSGTTNLDTATGNYVHVTGTTTITAITLSQGRQCTVVFDGILTLTNGASLLNPTSANITTAAGDVAVFRGEASGVVRCIEYNKKDGTALAGSNNDIQLFNATGTWTKPTWATGNEEVVVDIWDSGAPGGGRATTGSGFGGQGGAYTRLRLKASMLAGTETATVGALVAGVAGNTTGTTGNRSSFTINGTAYFITSSGAVGGLNSSSVATGPSTANALNAATVISSSAELGQQAAVTVASYVAATSTTYFAASSGGSASSTAADGGNGAGGGTGAVYGNVGGVAGTAAGGNGGPGIAPGGGGGGAVNGGTPGSGAAGRIIVTVLR